MISMFFAQYPHSIFNGDLITFSLTVIVFYFYRDDVSLMPVKWATRAVLLNDMKMLKEVIDDRENVYSVCAYLILIVK